MLGFREKLPGHLPYLCLKGIRDESGITSVAGDWRQYNALISAKNKRPVYRHYYHLDSTGK
jgi:hypothetical protein